MTEATVLAHFHGGPFDGETLPIVEDRLDDVVTLVAAPDGVRLGGPAAADDASAAREPYRLSAEASGLEGDVEYVYVTPLSG
ncbi:hypothetical protein AB0L40_11575 [Patulibacter sp. NPDC049589]|uniref:hypothetical protein n=1 Tax=Patulibacter sp. NPDC049589 TaxID=3154731 RepID=UPI0034316498